MMHGSPTVRITLTRTRHGTVPMPMDATGTNKENNMDIIRYIPRDHYISRQELSKITGMSDRAVRNEIQRLRTESPETIIISSSSKRGYKRPETYEELEACRRESISRLKAELAKVAQIDKVLKNRGQMGLGLV